MYSYLYYNGNYYNWIGTIYIQTGPRQEHPPKKKIKNKIKNKKTQQFAHEQVFLFMMYHFFVCIYVFHSFTDFLNAAPNRPNLQVFENQMRIRVGFFFFLGGGGGGGGGSL